MNCSKTRNLNGIYKLDLNESLAYGKEDIRVFHCTTPWCSSCISGFTRRKTRLETAIYIGGLSFKRKRDEYQQKTWPHGVAVGCWRLLRQRVHLLILPDVWDWNEQGKKFSELHTNMNFHFHHEMKQCSWEHFEMLSRKKLRYLWSGRGSRGWAASVNVRNFDQITIFVQNR